MQIILGQNRITKTYNLFYQSVWQPQWKIKSFVFVVVVGSIQNKLAWDMLMAHVNVA